MSNVFWLTGAQMARLQPFFPKSHDEADLTAQTSFGAFRAVVHGGESALYGVTDRDALPMLGRVAVAQAARDLDITTHTVERRYCRSGSSLRPGMNAIVDRARFSAICWGDRSETAGQ